MEHVYLTSKLGGYSMLERPTTTSWLDESVISFINNDTTSRLSLVQRSTTTSFYIIQDHSPASSNNWQVFFLLIIEAAGVLGNLLVCVSVAVEKRLRTTTNYILVSLAIADLFVSLIVMPGYIAQEFKGYWPFGLIMCALWQMADVIMCTSSIMHMCIISLDRYKCIRDPMSIRSRSKFSVAMRIAAVWFFAIIISTPLAFLAIFRPSDILNLRSECIISNPNFLVYGSIAAFFLPLLVMLITYSLTINLLRKKAAEIEGIGGLRRSVSNRKHPQRRSHPPLRSTNSLNCEEKPKEHWAVANDYSAMNGKHRIDIQLTSLTSNYIEYDSTKFTDLSSVSMAELKNIDSMKSQRTTMQTDEELRKEATVEEEFSDEKKKNDGNLFPRRRTTS